MSTNPAVMETVRLSPSTSTPRAMATAGLTYVMTVALAGPTSAMRAKKTRKASAVQMRARPSTESQASADGGRLGRDEHLVPGRGTQPCAELLASLPARGFAGTVAVEVSTAGLRKPAGEIYPARPYLEMVLDAGCPLALSSDAHQPDQVGFEYERAVELLESLGVRELAVFEGRERRLEPIG